MLRYLLILSFLIPNYIFAAELSVQQYPKHIDKKTDEFIKSSLDWLAKEQTQRGNWDQSAGLQNQNWVIASSSLAGLCFLASGSNYDSGPYAETIRKTVLYLLSIQGEKGEFEEGKDNRPMYGHCFAVLFLSEVYGTEESELVARKLSDSIKKAVLLIEKAQSPKGGWYYGFTNDNDEGSVTIAAIQALRAAKNAGFIVNAKVIDRGIQYLIDCQVLDGGIKYSFQSSTSQPIISVASLMAFYMCGVYEVKDETQNKRANAVKKLIEYVDKQFDNKIPNDFHSYPFYAYFYLSQAMWVAGDNYFDKHYPKIVDWLLNSVFKDKNSPSWIGDNSNGNAYISTAMALLILQIPYKNLPIWNR